MTSWKIYWLTRLDEIKNLLESLSVVLCISGFTGLLVTGIYVAMNNEPVVPLWAKVLITCFFVFWLLFMIAETLIPCEKDMAKIIVLPKIINNEKVKELPDQLLTLVSEWLEELKPGD